MHICIHDFYCWNLNLMSEFCDSFKPNGEKSRHCDVKRQNMEFSKSLKFSVRTEHTECFTWTKYKLTKPELNSQSISCILQHTAFGNNNNNNTNKDYNEISAFSFFTARYSSLSHAPGYFSPHRFLRQIVALFLCHELKPTIIKYI